MGKSSETSVQQTQNEAMEAANSKEPRGYSTKDGVTNVWLNRVSAKMVHDVKNDDIMKRVNVPIKESPTGFGSISVAFADGVNSSGKEVTNQAKHSRAIEKDDDGNFKKDTKVLANMYDINLGDPDKEIPVGISEQTGELNKDGKPRYTTRYVDMKVSEIAEQFYASKAEYAKSVEGQSLTDDDFGSRITLKNVNIGMVKDLPDAYNEKAPEPRKVINFTNLPSDISPTGRASITVPVSSIVDAQDRDRFGNKIDNTNYVNVRIGRANETVKLNVQTKEADRDKNGNLIKGTGAYESKWISCADLQKGFNDAKAKHMEHGPYKDDKAVDKVMSQAAEMNQPDESAEMSMG